MSEAERKARVFSLMEGYCQLGRLLDGDLDTDDEAAVAEVKLILAR